MALRLQRRGQLLSNSAYVGAFEALSYGTTTIVSYCHNIHGPGYADASIRALRESGIRHLFEHSFMSPPGDTFKTLDERFAEGRRVYETFHDPDSLTSIGFGVDSIGSPDIARQLAFARDYKAPSCIHVNETGTVAKKLHADGLLGPDFSVIHGNLLSNAELDAMAGAHMPLCFRADGRRERHTGRRRAPRPRSRRRRGVRLERHSLQRRDRHDRTAARHVQPRGGFLDGAMERSLSTVLGRSATPLRPGMPLLPPRELIRIATIVAARVLGMDEPDRLATTPGKRADIVLVQERPVRRFHQENDACAHVLLQTSPREIDTVMVDGSIRMRGGVLAGFDPERAASMVRASSRERILA